MFVACLCRLAHQHRVLYVLGFFFFFLCVCVCLRALHIQRWNAQVSFSFSSFLCREVFSFFLLLLLLFFSHCVCRERERKRSLHAVSPLFLSFCVGVLMRAIDIVGSSSSSHKWRREREVRFSSYLLLPFAWVPIFGIWIKRRFPPYLLTFYVYLVMPFHVKDYYFNIALASTALLYSPVRHMWHQYCPLKWLHTIFNMMA